MTKKAVQKYDKFDHAITPEAKGLQHKAHKTGKTKPHSKNKSLLKAAPVGPSASDDHKKKQPVATHKVEVGKKNPKTGKRTWKTRGKYVGLYAAEKAFMRARNEVTLDDIVCLQVLDDHAAVIGYGKLPRAEPPPSKAKKSAKDKNTYEFTDAEDAGVVAEDIDTDKARANAVDALTVDGETWEEKIGNDHLPSVIL